MRSPLVFSLTRSPLIAEADDELRQAERKWRQSKDPRDLKLFHMAQIRAGARPHPLTQTARALAVASRRIFDTGQSDDPAGRRSAMRRRFDLEQKFNELAEKYYPTHGLPERHTARLPGLLTHVHPLSDRPGDPPNSARAAHLRELARIARIGAPWWRHDENRLHYLGVHSTDDERPSHLLNAIIDHYPGSTGRIVGSSAPRSSPASTQAHLIVDFSKVAPSVSAANIGATPQ